MRQSRQLPARQRGAILALLTCACTCSTAVRPLTPEIVVTPLQVTFGDVPLNTTAQWPVEVKNVGRGALTVSGITPVTVNDITVPQLSLLTQDCQENPRSAANPLLLGSGECAIFQISFTPGTVESLTNTINVASNDPKTPIVPVQVTAAGVIAPFPQIKVCVLDATGTQTAGCTNLTATPPSIPTLDFGTVQYGQGAVRTLRVLSTGSSSLIVSNIRLSSSSPDLAIMGVPRLPDTLAVGASSDVQVDLAPFTSGAITGKVVFLSNDSSYPEVDIPITAQEVVPVTPAQIQVCVLDPSGAVSSAECTNFASTPPFIPTLNFGTVEYLQTVVRTVRILNRGEASLSVSALALTTSTPDLTLPSPPATPVNLAGGASTDVELSLTATGAGSITGQLDITSNDPTNPDVPVPIIAQEDPPCLQVTPTAIDFGTVVVGTSKMASMSIVNCGKSAYSISSWDFVPAVAGSTVFAVTPGDPSGGLPAIPFNFNPGDTHTLNLAYTPTAPTTDTGQFNVTTSYGATQVVPVVGMGAPQPEPQIQVCVLDASGNQNSADCTNFAATPPFIPTLDFGTVEYEQANVRTVRVLNIGQASLSVSGLNLTTSTADLTITSAPALPFNLAPGASADVKLSLTSSAGGAVTGQLDVLSNDPSHTDVPVPITAQEDPPCLQVTPAAINFGTITVGSSAMKSMSITNCGQSTYSISAWTFAPTNAGSTVFSVTPGDPSGGLPPIPFTFNPGDTHTLDLTYSPTVATTGAGDTGQFTVSTSYGANKVVPVVAQAATPVPMCGGVNAAVAKITVSQNGAAVTGSVLPLSTVALSGAPSTSPAGTSITSYTWTLLSSPATSTTTLQGSGESVTLLCSIVGTYQVELLVTDSAGCTSAQTTVNIAVVPGSGLHVQLTWPENYGDVDLHYLGPNGTFFDEPRDQGGTGSDNFFVYAVREFNGPGNPDPGSYPYGESQIDWGKNNTTTPDGTHADDPSLDADQLWGVRPGERDTVSAVPGEVRGDGALLLLERLRRAPERAAGLGRHAGLRSLLRCRRLWRRDSLLRLRHGFADGPGVLERGADLGGADGVVREGRVDRGDDSGDGQHRSDGDGGQRGAFEDGLRLPRRQLTTVSEGAPNP